MPAATSQVMKAWERRPKVAVEYLKGKRQTQIAQMFGVSQVTIHKDLKAMRKEWLQSALRDFDEAKAQELAKIDTLEVTYWEAWEASLGEASTTVTTAKDIDIELQVPKSLDRISKVRKGFGDARFLQGVQWCIDKRCKILGFDAPVKVQVSWRQELLELWKTGTITPEDIVDELGPDTAQEFFESAGIHYAGVGQPDETVSTATTL